MFGRKAKKDGFQGKAIYEIEDYLKIEARQAGNYEFQNGVVEKFNEPDFFIESVSKLKKTLSDKLADRGFQIFSNYTEKEKRVWIEAENSLMYPSLFVVGDTINYYPGREDIIANPLLIIEVSTICSMGSINGKSADWKYLSDRTNRFWTYQKISSLKEYVLIADIVPTIVIETYNKLEEGSWKYQVFSDRLFESRSVNFESIDLQLPIRDFYS